MCKVGFRFLGLRFLPGAFLVPRKKYFRQMLFILSKVLIFDISNQKSQS